MGKTNWFKLAQQFTKDNTGKKKDEKKNKSQEESSKKTEGTPKKSNDSNFKLAKNLISGGGLPGALELPVYPKTEQEEKVISDYIPSATQMTKGEYEMRRGSNPSLPEFGSYEYFKNLEQALRPQMDSIRADLDRQNIKKREWAENYASKEGWAKNNPKLREKGKQIHKKFVLQDSIIDEYQNIHEILKQFEQDGAHYKRDGSIDFKSGEEEAKYAQARSSYLAWTPKLSKIEEIPSPQKMHSYELSKETKEAKERQQQYYNEAYLERENVKAYQYTEKNWDNQYNDTWLGTGMAFARRGDINQRIANGSGLAAYKAKSSNMEGTEVYQALQKHLEKRNKDAYTTDGIVEKAIATTSEYLPQFRDQMIAHYAGKTVGTLVGMAVRDPTDTAGKIGGAIASSVQMFNMTAGATYVQLIQEYNLDPEEAHKLATNTAVASSAVEFGLEAALSGLGKGKAIIQKATGKTVKEAEKHLLKELTEAGFKQKITDVVLDISKRIGKALLSSVGEGVEEGLQAFVEKGAERVAKEGQNTNMSTLLVESLRFDKLSDEDWNDVWNQAYAGAFLGGVHGSVKVASDTIARKTIKTISDRMDSKSVGKAILADKSGNTVNFIVSEGLASGNNKTVKLAQSIERTISDKAEVDTTKLGQLAREIALQNSSAAQTTDAKEIIDFDSVLAKAGVSNDTRISIVSDLQSLQGEEGTNLRIPLKKAIQNIVSSVDAVESVSKRFNLPGNVYTLLEAHANFASSPDNVFTTDFVEKYADFYVDSLVEKGAVGYTSMGVTATELKQALVSDIVANNPGEKLSGNRVFERLANNFNDLVNKGFSVSNAMRNQLYAESPMMKAQMSDIQSGDWMSALSGKYQQATANTSMQDVPTVTETAPVYDNSEAKTQDDNTNVGQLFEDFDSTVDNILTVSDETAKEFADKRVAVEVLKNTPDVILNNVEDARNLKVIINYNKLYLAVRKNGVFKGHYHNLGPEIVKKLPEFLENPDAIIQLANGRLNLFAIVETERGNNGIVSVELNSAKDIGGKNEDYNVVVTMFSSDDHYAQNLISGDGVTEKYKREDLSQVNPQLYKWLATINDKSSNNNIISQDNDIVNSSVRSDTGNDAKSAKKSSVLSEVEKTMKPEIISNTELMSMLTDKFGGDGMEGLVNEIISRYNTDKSIGDFESLFTDEGKEIYRILQNRRTDNVKYFIESKINSDTDLQSDADSDIIKTSNHVLESEGNESESSKIISRRDHFDDENLGREISERAGELGREVQQNPRETQNRAFQERRKQQVKDVSYEAVPVSEYTEAMKALEQENLVKYKVKTVYFTGEAVNGKGDTANGFYYDGTLYLQIDSHQSMVQIRDHEITHNAEITHPKAYNKFRKALRGKLSRSEYLALFNQYRKEYADVLSNALKKIRAEHPNITFGQLQQYAEEYIDGEILANLNAGTTEYTARFADDIAEFRRSMEEQTATTDAQASTDSKSANTPAEYAESSDAGGANTDVSEMMSVGNDGFNDLDFDFVVRKVKMKVFPPYNESKSDANERATRWAHKNEVQTGAQKLISYHSRWYVIEKFDSSDLQYHIIGAVSTKEVNRFINEVKKRESGFKQAKQRVLDGLDDSVEIRSSIGLRRHDVDHDANQHRRTIKQIQSLAKNQDAKRTFSNDARGNIKSDGTNRQNRGGIDINGNSDATDNIGLDDGNLFAEKRDIAYSLKQRIWYPDLSKKQLAILKQRIKNDIKTSARSITDTTNWMFTNIEDTRVFAIYSTEDTTEPTLLYESKGEQAVFERNILLNMLEEYENGESVDRKQSMLVRYLAAIGHDKGTVFGIVLKLWDEDAVIEMLEFCRDNHPVSQAELLKASSEIYLKYREKIDSVPEMLSQETEK